MRHLVATGSSKTALCGSSYVGRRPLMTHVGPATGERAGIPDLVALRVDEVVTCPACMEVVLGVERAMAKALWAGAKPGG